MKKIRLLATGNLLAFMLQLIVSRAVQLKLINSWDVRQVSDHYPSLFTPAGITFAIWGLIYVLQAFFCIYHLSLAWKGSAVHFANRDLQKVGGLFMIGNLATAAWLVTWTHELLWISLMLIFTQLFVLGEIYLRLRIYDKKASGPSKWFTQLPFSVWFAWITIATIANAAVCFSAAGGGGMGIGSVNWTLVLIALSVLITLGMLHTHHDIFFGLVVIWTLAGIVLKRTEGGMETSRYPVIVFAALGGMIVVGVIGFVQWIKERTPKKPVTPLFPSAPHASLKQE